MKNNNKKQTAKILLDLANDRTQQKNKNHD